ncbi:MAG: HEPN domain-containing protein [Ruminococcaceae bacterium]|nr:HEPN domain-containing protein [Oscillospiraceae bacterium]
MIAGKSFLLCCFSFYACSVGLDGFDSKKHFGVISEFQKLYIKTGVFDKEMSVVIRRLFLARNNSDYDDFFIISKEDAVRQFEDAKMFVLNIRKYLETVY